MRLNFISCANRYLKLHFSTVCIRLFLTNKRDKNGPSKICARQPLKSLKLYGLLDMVWPYSRPYHFKFVKGCLPQVLLGLFLNTLPQMHLIINMMRDRLRISLLILSKLKRINYDFHSPWNHQKTWLIQGESKLINSLNIRDQIWGQSLTYFYAVIKIIKIPNENSLEYISLEKWFYIVLDKENNTAIW